MAHRTVEQRGGSSERQTASGSGRFITPQLTSRVFFCRFADPVALARAQREAERQQEEEARMRIRQAEAEEERRRAVSDPRRENRGLK